MELDLAPLFPATCKEQKLEKLVVNMNDVFTCDMKGSLPYIKQNTIVMNNNQKIVLSDNDTNDAFKQFKVAQSFHSNDKLCKQNEWTYTADVNQQAAYDQFVAKYKIG